MSIEEQKQKPTRQEHNDEHSWQIIEFITGPTTTVTIKQNNIKMLIFNGSELRYEGDYDPKLYKKLIKGFKTQQNAPKLNEQPSDSLYYNNSGSKNGSCGCCLISAFFIFALITFPILFLHFLTQSIINWIIKLF